MTTYRELDPQELISEGDEWLTLSGTAWKKTINAGKTPRSMGNPYRRPIAGPYFPEWKYDKAPGCPVHVVWAETPVGTPVVAPDVSGATPRASESIPGPGEGYRLLKKDELVVEGDEYLSGSDWQETNNHVMRGGRQNLSYPYRRKIVGEPKYRPYDNAGEAASALQGKLFHMPNSHNWWTVLSISKCGISFGDDFAAFSELCAEYVSTDGTPCGIQIND